MKKKKEWLEFVDQTIEGMKTRNLTVYNNTTGEWLGKIKWKRDWRQYVFDDREIVLAEGCLLELYNKIKELRESRKNRTYAQSDAQIRDESYKT